MQKRSKQASKLKSSLSIGKGEISLVAANMMQATAIDYYDWIKFMWM